MLGADHNALALSGSGYKARDTVRSDMIVDMKVTIIKGNLDL